MRVQLAIRDGTQKGVAAGNMYRSSCRVGDEQVERGCVTVRNLSRQVAVNARMAVSPESQLHQTAGQAPGLPM